MKRVISLDVLRGLTIALMIVANLPGSWSAVLPMMRHAAWNGFTVADFIFPSFVFVMGVSMFFSLRKQEFKPNWKILRRFVLLLGVGLGVNAISMLLYSRGSIRLTGVLVRLALCYGLSAAIICSVKQKALPWIAGGLLVLYGLVLLLFDGYVHGPENIVARIDRAILGQAHLYKDKGVDPEGLLSTIPAVAHTLIGFLMGKIFASKDFRKMDSWGTALLVAGFLLQWLLPINKKIWSPSFVLVVCGADTLILSLLHYLIDETGVWKHTGFFRSFGSNAIFCYLLSDVLAWTFSLTGFQGWVMRQVGVNQGTSLLFALFCLLLIYLTALPLYRKKIFIKL